MRTLFELILPWIGVVFGDASDADRVANLCWVVICLVSMRRARRLS